MVIKDKAPVVNSSDVLLIYHAVSVGKSPNYLRSVCEYLFSEPLLLGFSFQRLSCAFTAALEMARSSLEAIKWVIRSQFLVACWKFIRMIQSRRTGLILFF